MRYFIGLVCVLALGVMPMVGCSDTTDDGGTGGIAGSGGSGGIGGGGGEAGMAGSGGTGGMPECQSPEDCDDFNDCTGNACAGGICEYTPLADGTTCDESNECTTGVCADGECDTTPVQDGTACNNGVSTCQAGLCGNVACTEQGIRDAIATGGGPYTFRCDGPQTVVTQAPIEINNDVILDGAEKLTVDGNDDHHVFSVPEGVTAELRGFTLANGTSSEYGHGGAIQIYGQENGTATVTLMTCTVSGNTGGGISSGGTLNLVNSTVSDNIGRGIVSRGPLTLTDSIVSGNSGGGIVASGEMTLIVDSTVSGNTSIDGGGISLCLPLAFDSWPLTLINSTVSGNSASGGGGGICGGEPLTLTNSTVSGNSAEYGGGIVFAVDATFINSTVSGNSAATDGGGILVTVDATLINSTVSGNSASNPRGDGIWQTEGMLRLLNTTVLGNVHVADRLEHLEIRGSVVAGACTADGPPGPGASSNGYNIESPGNTCGLDDPTDQVEVTAEELNLGPLADNGGPTMTHPLAPVPFTMNPAIDQIPEADCVDADGLPLTTDQRGSPRPVAILGPEPMCDVGSFEVQP